MFISIPKLSRDSLDDQLVKLIVNCMPATIVDCDEFEKLFKICNLNIGPILLGSDGVMGGAKTQFCVCCTLLKAVLAE